MKSESLISVTATIRQDLLVPGHLPCVLHTKCLFNLHHTLWSRIHLLFLHTWTWRLREVLHKATRLQNADSEPRQPDLRAHVLNCPNHENSPHTHWGSWWFFLSLLQVTNGHCLHSPWFPRVIQLAPLCKAFCLFYWTSADGWVMRKELLQTGLQSPEGWAQSLGTAWGDPGKRRQQANIPDGEILAPVQGWRDQVLPRGVALVPAGSSQAFWDCLGFSLGRSWDHVPFQGTSFLLAITYPHVYVSQPTVPGWRPVYLSGHQCLSPPSDPQTFHTQHSSNQSPHLIPRPITSRASSDFLSSLNQTLGAEPPFFLPSPVRPALLPHSHHQELSINHLFTSHLP